MRNDLLLILRGFARAPLTALLAMAALCVGVAVTTSVFTVARGVLADLPYPDSDRLVLIWRGTARAAAERGPLSPPDYIDIRDQATGFSGVAAVNSFSTTYLPEAGDPEQVQLGVVAGDFFGVIGVRALVGRGLEPPDDRPLNTRDSAAAGVIVLDHGFWVRAFAGDSRVVGRTIDLGGRGMRVVGVMPPSFRLHMPAGAGMSTDLVGWTPLGIDYSVAPRDGAYLKLVARLAPGASRELAQAELDAIAGRLRSATKAHEEAGTVLRVADLKREVTAHIRPILLLLSASGLLLLIVACANAATLLLVRFLTRRQDAAIRRALGAAEVRVIRPLLLESAVIAVGGTAAGVLLAGPAVRLLLGLEPGIVPRTGSLDVDAAVVITALGGALVLAVVCGLGPALVAARGELSVMLRRQRAATTLATRRLRQGIIVAQAAASFALLYTSATLLGTLVRLQRTDIGFSHQSVMTARVTLPFVRYQTPGQWVRFFEELSARLENAPGVSAAALTSDIPMEGDLTLEPFAPAELNAGTEWGRFSSLYRIVTPGYFAAIGIPLRAGRDFSREDREGTPDVILVDEALAGTLSAIAPGGIVGRRLVITVHEFRAGYRVTQRTAEIVGVVGTVAHEHPDAPPPGTIYVSHAQYPIWSMRVTARGTTATPTEAILRTALQDLDTQLPLSSVRPLRAVVDRSLASTRFVLALVGLLAGAVVVLTAAGLFGVVAESVRQRRRELAIRLAVGASPLGLALRTLRGGIALTAMGILPGLLLAPAASRLLERSVPGTGFAPLALLAAAVALFGGAAFACFTPAWRASRVNPSAALREE